MAANVSYSIMDLMINSTLAPYSNSSSCQVPVQRGLTRKMTVMSSIAILTILGNVAIIIAIIKRKCKMSRMYYLILHLSLADLLTAVLTLLPEVAWTATLPQFYGGIVTCKLLKVLQMLGPYLSSYILCVTAIDRYQAICKPLQSCYWSPNKSKIMLLVAWLISLLCCLPQAFIFTIKEKSFCRNSPNTVTYQRCHGDFTGFINGTWYVIFFTVANFVVPVVVLLFCYSCICNAIWANFRRKTGGGSAGLDKTGQYGERASLADQRRWNILRNLRSCCSRSKAQQNTFELDNVQLPKMTPDLENLERSELMPTPKCRIVIDTDGHDGHDESDQQQNGMSIRANGLASRAAGSTGRTNGSTGRETGPTGRSNGLSKRGGGSGGHSHPRTHSVRGITRAKMKTVKLTVTVMICYFLCSFPFIIGQFVSVFGTETLKSFFANKLEFLYWLLTLNSVTNPWIYLVFNENLVQSLKSCFSGGNSPSPTNARRSNTTIAIRHTPSGLSSRYSLTTTTDLPASRKSSPGAKSTSVNFPRYSITTPGEMPRNFSRKVSAPIN